MGVLADEYIRLHADTSRMPRDLRKAGDRAGKDFGGAFSGAFKGLLAGAAIVGAAAVLARGLKTTVLAASDMNETMNKSNIIFGKNAKTITKWAGTASTSLGLSRQQAIDAAAGFGDMFKQLGFSGDAATRMSKSTVQLAADLGSFNNLPTADVQERIAAAFRGEYDSLQKVIPNINAARVQQVALTETGKRSVTQLTAQEKAHAVLSIIQKDGKRATGDFARTQGGLANQLKIAKAQLGDLAVTVGTAFLPAITKAAKWFTETGLPAIQDFFKKISKDKELKTALENLKTALAGLTDKDFKQALLDVAAALPAIINGFATATTRAGQFYDAITKFEDLTSEKEGGPLGGIANAMTRLDARITQTVINLRTRVVNWIGQMWAEAKASFIQNHSEILARVGQFVDRVVGWFASLPGRVMVWVRKLWADAKASFIRNHTELLAGVSRFLARMIAFFVGWFTNLRTRWSIFWTGIKKTGSDAINSVRTTIDRVLGLIRTGFSRGVTAIGRAWDKIKAVARTPVAFVVNTVLNNGLLKAFRAISKIVNYGPGKNFTVSMRRGGILPGYTPGRDVHRFYSPTGGTIDLSGGEGIARPELARAIGKKRWDAANRDAMHGKISSAVGHLGGFFLGGFAPVPGSGNRHSGYPWATWAGDFPNPSGTPVRAWASGRVAAVKNWNYSYGRHVRINHPGNKQTLYAHLSTIIARLGAAIGRGEILGRVGSTGNSTGPHLHFELKGGQGVLGGKNGAGALAPLISAAKYISQVTSALGKLKGIGGGQFGQMVAAGARLIGDKVKDKITSLVSTFNSANAGSTGSGFTSVSGGSNRAIGKRMMLQKWGANEWPALNTLWTGESNWNHRARNSSSGAYGIPQSLPADKMRSAGADYLTNPATQIKWGLGYIASRYGSPSAALRAWNSRSPHWYGNGGVINEPVMGLGMRTGARYGFGEHGPETVTPGRGGGRPISIFIDLGDGLVQKVQGIIDDNDEFRATVGRTR